MEPSNSENIESPSYNSSRERCLKRLAANRSSTHRLPPLALCPVCDGLLPREIYNEVIIEGVSKPGASAVPQAPWIKVASISIPGSMPALSKQFGLEAGETGAVILAHELGIQLVLRDESRGRRIAQQRGLAVVGCLGLLKQLYRRRALPNFEAPIESCSRKESLSMVAPSMPAFTASDRLLCNRA